MVYSESEGDIKGIYKGRGIYKGDGYSDDVYAVQMKMANNMLW